MHHEFIDHTVDNPNPWQCCNRDCENSAMDKDRLKICFNSIGTVKTEIVPLPNKNVTMKNKISASVFL